MSIVRASVIQAAPVAFDLEGTLEKLRGLAADAAKDGAKLAVFPEAFVSAYPKGLDFGARIGMRFPEGREDFRRYYESSVEVPGPAVDFLGEVASENKLFFGGRRHRAGWRHPLLHGAEFWPRRDVFGQTPQADADGAGAPGVGLW